MKRFVVNRYGRLVFPFNFFPELDFSVFRTLDQFAAVVRRDFEDKAPTEAEILARLETGADRGRYELLRDLLVCGEKFSDKIGTVRTSRMIFGDGAAALVVGPAPTGAPTDVEYFQTYASGPMCEVDSIIWPNPEFDNNLTVYGPDVRTLVERYVSQMLDEIRALGLLEAIDLVIPHQANQTMVEAIAQKAGLPSDRLYFNIAKVGNTSSASIPLAIHDAVRDGVITRPMRVFAPGFGAGAVAGYLILRVDPEVVAVSRA